MSLHRLIGRLSSPVQLAGFYVYNKIFPTPRSRIIVQNKDGKLLLVRNWGGKNQWGFPGGGVKRKEHPIDAAKRELFEEIGILVATKDLKYVTTLSHQYEAWIYSVTVSEGDVPVKPHNPREIIDLQWFSPEVLPTNLSPLVHLALKKLSKSD